MKYMVGGRGDNRMRHLKNLMQIISVLGLLGIIAYYILQEPDLIVLIVGIVVAVLLFVLSCFIKPDRITEKERQRGIIWKDRKRILGMPITFIRYRMSQDRLFFETGLLNIKGEEILLYRVRDMSVSITMWQRLTGVGTVTIISTDKSVPSLAMRNIKNPRGVKELIHKQVEMAKIAYRVRYTEMMGDMGPGSPGMVDMNGNGIPDYIEDI